MDPVELLSQAAHEAAYAAFVASIEAGEMDEPVIQEVPDQEAA